MNRRTFLTKVVLGLAGVASCKLPAGVALVPMRTIKRPTATAAGYRWEPIEVSDLQLMDIFCAYEPDGTQVKGMFMVVALPVPCSPPGNYQIDCVVF